MLSRPSLVKGERWVRSDLITGDEEKSSASGADRLYQQNSAVWNSLGVPTIAAAVPSIRMCCPNSWCAAAQCGGAGELGGAAAGAERALCLDYVSCRRAEGPVPGLREATEARGWRAGGDWFGEPGRGSETERGGWSGRSDGQPAVLRGRRGPTTAGIRDQGAQNESQRSHARARTRAPPARTHCSRWLCNSSGSCCFVADQPLLSCSNVRSSRRTSRSRSS